MEDVQPESIIDFIPTICFIKRGVAKECPDKVVLTPEELARVIEDTKEQLDSEEDNDSDDDDGNEENDEIMETNDNENHNQNDEFNFNRYDSEETAQVASISTIAAVNENDMVDCDDDSEAEDDIIKPTDNLILVGHVTDDSATMEVWVFNENEESLYTHHDFILPSFPLCIEWFNHDPGSNKSGNMCAIGHMDPIVTIWDLDIQDSFEPTFKLGSKGSRKKNKPKYGHTDAVLDLSWNTHYPHILSSGSVDKTVILWDLDEGQPHTTIKAFKEKVQSIKFHPTEAQSLLTGSADGLVKLFDCRDPETVNTNFKKWNMNGEVEKVVWNSSDTNYFMTGMNDGRLAYVDMRQSQILWTINAHQDEISDICFNSKIDNLFTTSSADGYFKIWKFDNKEIKEIYKHDFGLGRLQCMKQCPEDPFTLAFGGEKIPKFKVFNIKNVEAVRMTFNIDDYNTE